MTQDGNARVADPPSGKNYKPLVKLRLITVQTLDSRSKGNSERMRSQSVPKNLHFTTTCGTGDSALNFCLEPKMFSLRDDKLQNG